MGRSSSSPGAEPPGAACCGPSALRGGYLLLYVGFDGEPARQTLFVQELDARGSPVGERLAVTGGDYLGVDGAVASLPDGRWLVVTRSQKEQPGDPPVCNERLVGTVLSSGD